MDYKFITSDNFRPVCWSGGTTTELFIFPETADYHKQNFLFRLSTATVEADKSDFTLLYGISRKLMVLAGEITLSHEDHYSRQLKKFDVDEFEGDWKTSSIGKCTDFNLMTTGKTTGELTPIVIEKEQNGNYCIKKNCDRLFIYIYNGKAIIHINNKIATINKGDLIILNKITEGNIELTGIDYSEIVFTEITLNENRHNNQIMQ